MTPVKINIQRLSVNSISRSHRFLLAFAKSIELSLIFMLFSVSVVNAQWYKLVEVPTGLCVIHFLDFPGYKNVGFLGRGIFAPDGSVLKTTDYGITWKETVPNTIASAVTNFSFKDSLVGFLSAGFNSGVINYPPNGGCYKTTDGGENWVHLPSTKGTTTSVFYNSNINALIVARWYNTQLISYDLGQTFIQRSSDFFQNGFAFANGFEGIIGSVWDNFGQVTPFNRTIDGGISSIPAASLPETWQPLAIANTKTYFALSEQSHEFLRSDNAGLTWNVVSTVPFCTGTIMGTLDRMSIQAKVFNGGVFVSTDQGVNWERLCGPFNTFADVRHFQRDSIIYATDFYRLPNSGNEIGRLWVNTTGKASSSRVLLKPSLGSSPIALGTGETINIDIILPEILPTLPNLTLDSVSILLRYDTDVLSFKESKAHIGWNITFVQEEDRKLWIKCVRDHSIIPQQLALLSLTFQGNVARDTTTFVTVDSVYYNQGQINNCELLATEQVAVNITNGCGDRELRSFILSTPVLLIQSIYPNPTNNDITVEFYSAINHPITVQLLNDIGLQFYEQQYSAMQGKNILMLHLKPDASGTIYIRLVMGRDVVTGKFVKQKSLLR